MLGAVMWSALFKITYIFIFVCLRLSEYVLPSSVAHDKEKRQFWSFVNVDLLHLFQDNMVEVSFSMIFIFRHGVEKNLCPVGNHEVGHEKKY